MQDKTKFCYKTTLKTDYGLTPKWIERLGEPDKYVVNPNYRTGPKASLYRRERVERLIDENQVEWDALQVTRAKRSQAAQAVHDKNRAALVAWASEVEIKIFELPEQFQELGHNVKERGLSFYEGIDFMVSPNAVTAYVRHNATNYEYLLAQVSGQVGTLDAYLIIKQRVNERVDNHLIERYGDGWQNDTETGYGYGHPNS